MTSEFLSIVLTVAAVVVGKRIEVKAAVQSVKIRL